MPRGSKVERPLCSRESWEREGPLRVGSPNSHAPEADVRPLCPDRLLVVRPQGWGPREFERTCMARQALCRASGRDGVEIFLINSA